MSFKRKVVLASELVRIEKEAIEQGESELSFMETAGRSLADCVEGFINRHALPRKIYLLVGKGNNGGDAYATGSELLTRGYYVEAFSFYPLSDSSPLLRKQHERFLAFGGKVSSFHEPKEGVLLDGLVGTGFRGKAEGVLYEAIALANSLSLPILALDIPSGLCAETGRVGSIAIRAQETFYLEFPKMGFFLEDGWEHVGRLRCAFFGLPSSYQEKVQGKAFLLEEVGASLLPPMRRDQNKYEAGHVLVLAGGPHMRGAGILSSYAALRAGAGIVRWFYESREGVELTPLHPEVIQVPIEGSMTSFFGEMKRASSLVLGPGMGRTKESFWMIKKALSSCALPMVVDADALFFLHQHPSLPLSASCVLTPHRGEMQRLFDSSGDFLREAQSYVEKKGVYLLAKGAPNFLFAPGALPVILPYGNPGMATAGAGDVLSGILGALLAKKMRIDHAIYLGTFLHGLAGDLAAAENTEFCLTAGDLIDYLPRAFLQVKGKA